MPNPRSSTVDLSDVQIKLPDLHDGQKKIIASDAKYKVVCCGRRFGKTLLVIDCLVNDLLNGLLSMYGAPTRHMASQTWRELKNILGPLIAADMVKINETYRTVEMVSTEGFIEFWSLDNPERLRGRKFNKVYLDEAALIPEMDVWTDIIQPTLLDFDGDAMFPSTPRGRNWYWQLFNRGVDELQPLWASFKMPSAVNPYLPSWVIDRYRNELPERTFAQEYLAEFMDDAGAVFRGVDDIAILQSIDPYPGKFVIGVDWARVYDFTVFAVFDAEKKHMVEIVRFQDVNFVIQKNRLLALYERWKPFRVVAEQNSMGMSVVEDLQAYGLPVRPFFTSVASKPMIIEGLQLAIERGDVWVLNHPVVVHELKAYEQTRMPSGRIRYDAPPGAHDDTVIAIALAWDEIRQLGSSFGGAMPKLW